MSHREDRAGRHEVVAGLLTRDRQVLLCHRAPERRWYPDVWDLAGGHVDRGERREEALARELREELGLVVSPPTGAPLAVLSEGRELSLAIYLVRDWLGDPVNRAPEEHDEIRWFGGHEVEHLTLAHPALARIIEDALR
jgi:8-oxo-dGTP diphosphatase